MAILDFVLRAAASRKLLQKTSKEWLHVCTFTCARRAEVSMCTHVCACVHMWGKGIQLMPTCLCMYVCVITHICVGGECVFVSICTCVYLHEVWRVRFQKRKLRNWLLLV